jgi:hypothetical protein
VAALDQRCERLRMVGAESDEPHEEEEEVPSSADIEDRTTNELLRHKWRPPLMPVRTLS